MKKLLLSLIVSSSFVATHLIHSFQAKLEVICGPMFAGKSEELIRRLIRADIAHQSISGKTNARYTRCE